VFQCYMLTYGSTYFICHKIYMAGSITEVLILYFSSKFQLIMYFLAHYFFLFVHVLDFHFTRHAYQSYSYAFYLWHSLLSFKFFYIYTLKLLISFWKNSHVIHYSNFNPLTLKLDKCVIVFVALHVSGYSFNYSIIMFYCHLIVILF